MKRPQLNTSVAHGNGQPTKRARLVDEAAWEKLTKKAGVAKKLGVVEKLSKKAGLAENLAKKAAEKSPQIAEKSPQIAKKAAEKSPQIAKKAAEKSPHIAKKAAEKSPQIAKKAAEKSPQRVQKQQSGKKAQRAATQVRHIANPTKAPGYLAPKIESGGAAAAVRKSEWTNRQRLLTVASRGVSYLGRHLLKDFQALLPQAKSDSKFAGKDRLVLLNEIAETRNSSHVMYLETRRKQDLYMWLSKAGTGPSVKFHAENVHTMSELKLTGNCLRASRHIVAFDTAFDTSPHLRVIKELLTQVLGVPRSHPRSKPFVDHVLLLAWLDGRVWLRNFQIVDDNGAMAEIGPRCALRPVRVWSGSFTGPCLFDNPAFVPPARLRADNRMKYVSKLQARLRQQMHSDLPTYVADPTDQVFQ